MAVPKRKTGRARTHTRRSSNDQHRCARSRSVCPAVRRSQASAPRVPELRLLQEPRSRRDGLAAEPRGLGTHSSAALTSLPAHRARRATRREAFW